MGICGEVDDGLGFNWRLGGYGGWKRDVFVFIGRGF